MKLTYILASAALAVAACTYAGTGSEAPVSDTLVAEAAPARNAVKEITNDRLPKAVKKPVVIDCWATWCGPCQKFKPVYHQVASEMSGKIDFYAMDVDVNSGVSGELGITSIPTVVVILPGKKPIFKSGYMDKATFKAYLKSVIK